MICTEIIPLTPRLLADLGGAERVSIITAT
jgi:hypothetical protein